MSCSQALNFFLLFVFNAFFALIILLVASKSLKSLTCDEGGSLLHVNELKFVVPLALVIQTFLLSTVWGSDVCARSSEGNQPREKTKSLRDDLEENGPLLPSFTPQLDADIGEKVQQEEEETCKTEQPHVSSTLQNPLPLSLPLPALEMQVLVQKPPLPEPRHPPKSSPSQKAMSSLHFLLDKWKRKHRTGHHHHHQTKQVK